MQITDIVANLLTCIRNASVAKHDSVEIPKNNIKESVIKIPIEERCVGDYTMIKDGKQGILKVNLKYGEGKTPVIEGLRRMSRPGLCIYSNAEDLPKVLEGPGIAIISTSKSVVADRQTRKENVGGEVLAFIR